MEPAKTSQSELSGPPSASRSPCHSVARRWERLMLGRYSNAAGLRDYLTTLFKHKYKILIAFFVVTLLATAGIVVYLKFLYTPLFEARSLLLVKFGWENRTPELSLGSRAGSGLQSERHCELRGAHSAESRPERAGGEHREG